MIYIKVKDFYTEDEIKDYTSLGLTEETLLHMAYMDMVNAVNTMAAMCPTVKFTWPAPVGKPVTS